MNKEKMYRKYLFIIMIILNISNIFCCEESTDIENYPVRYMFLTLGCPQLLSMQYVHPIKNKVVFCVVKQIYPDGTFLFLGEPLPGSEKTLEQQYNSMVQKFKSNYHSRFWLKEF